MTGTKCTNYQMNNSIKNQIYPKISHNKSLSSTIVLLRWTYIRWTSWTRWKNKMGLFYDTIVSKSSRHMLLHKTWKTSTAWRVRNYGVFSGPYFPAFKVNTERYGVSLRIQSECGKIWTRKNFVFWHFWRSETDTQTN